MLVPLLAIPARAADPLDPVLGDPGVTLPNLVPNVEELWIQSFRYIDENFTEEPGLFLWFDTRAQNLGTVPMQLTVDKVETPETSTVSQCVSWRSADGHVCRATERAGGYTWHGEHSHFHYTDFAAYQLRRLAPDGRPDYSPSGLLAVSEKVSFCFVDSSTARDDAGPQFYQTCLPTVQGISPGWTDVYRDDLPGQNLSIEGVPNGRYALITDIDYENTLRETSDADNYVEVTIEISDADPDDWEWPAGRKAEILGRHWPAPDDRGTATSTTTTVTTPPTTTSTTTTVTTPPTTTTTTTAPNPTGPESMRTLRGGASGYVPVPRRRGTVPRTGCSKRQWTCGTSWLR